MTEPEPVLATVSDLKPRMKNLTISFKVLEKGETREVTSRHDGATHRVADTVVGDSTGTVVIPLWDDTIEQIEVGKTYKLENGYTGLFQRHLRLNIGRYGVINDAEEEIEEVDMENDLSALEHERPQRSYGGGDRYGGGGYRRDSGGGRDRGGGRRY
ncbi:MAG: single-stranded DNA-binding protein [Candidatus Thorarchaeota archaeon]|jgi:replication factor A1